METALTSSIELMFGSNVAADAEGVELPSDSTMSRSTYKLDLAHMHLRRLEWAAFFKANKAWSVQLGDSIAPGTLGGPSAVPGFDSSPLQRDFFMCYEWSCEPLRHEWSSVPPRHRQS